MNAGKYCLLTALAVMLVDVDALSWTTVDFDGYYKWSPYGQPNDELNCPDLCVGSEDDRCCSCRAKRCCEINATACGEVVGKLYLEPIDIFGNAVVEVIPNTTATLYELVHSNHRLSSVPDNLCEWANVTVKLDLRYNRLTNISTLSCMTQLDTLLLSNNSISHLDNRTFAGMEHLRVLSIAHNNMRSIDPNAIAIKSGNILTADLSWNHFPEVDVTNIFRHGSFCYLNYEGSAIMDIVNVNNFTAYTGPVLGPGEINLNKTQLGSFFNFTLINLQYTSVTEHVLGRVFIDDSYVNCDCTLYKLFSGLGRAVFELWGNILGHFICRAPKSIIGFNLSNIYEGDNINLLRCDIIATCPRFCACIDIPSEDKVLVNCSYRGLTELPSNMPIGVWNTQDVDLLVEHNNIRRIDHRNYIHRLVNLDLTGNPVAEIDEMAAQTMSSKLTLDIEDQVLKDIPRGFEPKNPRNIRFGENPIVCTCDNTWIGGWMRYHNRRGLLSCMANDWIRDTADVSATSLECYAEEPVIKWWQILLISLLVLIAIILLTLITWYYRYEILLLKRKFLTSQECADYEFDVFLSFCEENYDVFSWIRLFILPALLREGYRVFCPWFSIGEYGENREYIVTDMASKSKHFVVCLCDMYQTDINSVMDFNVIWKNFLNNTSKKITIINFAHIRKRHIKDRRILAFRRIRDDLSYKCTKSKLFTQLRKRIGPPRPKDVPKPVDQVQHPLDEGCQELKQVPQPEVDENVAECAPTPSKNVFDRLYVPQKHSICNCTYRKCYLKPGDLHIGNASHRKQLQQPGLTHRQYFQSTRADTVANRSVEKTRLKQLSARRDGSVHDRFSTVTSQEDRPGSSPDTNSLYSCTGVVLPNVVSEDCQSVDSNLTEQSQSSVEARPISRFNLTV